MKIRHFYIEKGEGFPLILLHGNGEDCGYFANQIDEFAKFYRVLALDTRGHGKTPRGDAPFTIEQFAEDLVAFFDQKGIEKAHILGFSDGGNIALRFALDCPDRVQKLILNGANLTPSGVKRSTQIPIELAYAIASKSAKNNENARKNAEMLGLMVNQPNVPLSALSQIHAPTLVIVGTRDMIKKKHTEQIAAAIQGSTLAVIHGDHFIANKNPSAFNHRVLQFLGE